MKDVVRKAWWRIGCVGLIAALSVACGNPCRELVQRSCSEESITAAECRERARQALGGSTLKTCRRALLLLHLLNEK